MLDKDNDFEAAATSLPVSVKTNYSARCWMALFHQVIMSLGLYFPEMCVVWKNHNPLPIVAFPLGPRWQAGDSNKDLHSLLASEGLKKALQQVMESCIETQT